MNHTLKIFSLFLFIITSHTSGSSDAMDADTLDLDDEYLGLPLKGTLKFPDGLVPLPIRMPDDQQDFYLGAPESPDTPLPDDIPHLQPMPDMHARAMGWITPFYGKTDIADVQELVKSWIVRQNTPHAGEPLPTKECFEQLNELHKDT